MAAWSNDGQPIPSGIDARHWPTQAERVDVAAAYRAHGQQVYALARSLCGANAAEDVAQEVFLRLARRPQMHDPTRGTMRTLLLTITHHCAVEHLRSSATRLRRDQRWGVDPAGVAAIDVERQVLDRERSTQIRAAIERLPRAEREAIVTAYYGNCTYREAAAVLGEPEGTVKARIRAALTRLSLALRDASSAPPSVALTAEAGTGGSRAN